MDLIDSCRDELEEKAKRNDPPPAPNLRAKVEVKYKGNPVDNINDPPYYLEKNRQMTFDLTFPYLPEGGLGYEVKIYDPYIKDWINPTQKNADYFYEPKAVIIGSGLHVTIGRNGGTGISEGGEVWYVIEFSKDVIINGKEDGVKFSLGLTADKTMYKDLLIFRFTVNEENGILVSDAEEIL